MKKIVLYVSFILTLAKLNAQNTTFGVTIGYNSFIASVKFDGASATSSASGGYLGVFAEFQTSEKFSVQPELQYVHSSKDGESGSTLLLPVLGKYRASNEFSLLFGPQFDYLLEDSEGINKLGIGLSAGLNYDFSKKLFASLRYSLGLNNRLEESAIIFDESDPVIFDLGEIKTKLNFFQVGIGYRF